MATEHADRRIFEETKTRCAEKESQHPAASIEQRKAQIALLHAARVSLGIVVREHREQVRQG